MTPGINIFTSQAIDEAAAAIQHLARVIFEDNSPLAQRHDLQEAFARLAAAITKVGSARELMSPKGNG